MRIRAPGSPVRLDFRPSSTIGSARSRKRAEIEPADRSREAGGNRPTARCALGRTVWNLPPEEAGGSRPSRDEAAMWSTDVRLLSERLGGILDRLTRRGALTDADVDAALREVRRALLEADVALDVVRAFTDKVKSEAVGVERDQVGDARPAGRQDRARPADRDAGRAGRADRPQRAGAGADHDGRPAGLRQDHHHRQDRQAPHRARPPQGADGLARRAPPGRDGAARRARPADRRRDACRSSQASSRRRSRSARCRPAASAATTWCCSTPPAAPRSTRR